MQDIIYITEKELLATTFTVVMKVKYVSDMFVPIGYDDILLEGSYKTAQIKISKLHDDDEYCDLQLEKANFMWLKNYYTNSDYAKFYGKSDIFTEQQFIDAVQKFLPISIIHGKYKRYYYLIDNNYEYTAYSSEKVRDKLISQDTRDIFFGTEQDLNTFIKNIKKLDKR